HPSPPTLFPYTTLFRSQELKRSPLHERHVTAGAKFAEFGGWSMPLEYAGTNERKGGVLAEHEAVRSGVGVFDVSHLGKVVVSGTDRKSTRLNSSHVSIS